LVELSFFLSCSGAKLNVLQKRWLMRWHCSSFNFEKGRFLSYDVGTKVCCGHGRTITETADRDNTPFSNIFIRLSLENILYKAIQSNLL
jgi:hypothetical protein